MSDGAQEKTEQDSVCNSARIVETTHTIAKPGYLTLKVWMVDSGVALQKIVVETGRVGATYLGPPGTTFVEQ